MNVLYTINYYNYYSIITDHSENQLRHVALRYVAPENIFTLL